METPDINKVVQAMRKDYAMEQLDETMVASHPLKQFESWMLEAVKGKIMEPNAMVLSTVSSSGRPSSRVVLLKEFDEKGFGFYTNFESRKGVEMLGNKNICLNFFWPELERQIRIEGTVSKQLDEVADDYFQSRPKASRTGAWASAQSTHLTNRKELEDKYLNLLKQHDNVEVNRPPYWGGFLLNPDYFEFWQGRQSRLHDRIIYEKINSQWKIGRLSP
ncbi:MAG: pyridoxamine 5'-phosphate oxidase [Bacteroidia bacterium]|nr:pyridoxamine 5'-phosphate oxidase [Bacteroidia bacterium]